MVINNEGQNLGVMNTNDAIHMAQEIGLDLVEINGSATPVIAKIMDYGKYKYEQKKHASEAKKKQKVIETKDIWVKPFIEENDLNIKLKKVFEWLAAGNKVKISAMTRGNRRVLFRGKDSIPQLFDHIVEVIGDRGTLESKSKPEDRTKSILIAPAKK
ncbi:MAG: translation initiation factor IF-3 [Alphaproteobacteria bacterium]|nr:translation initiation factor IF-3 [Alphaproteobacteria bacterium]